MTSTPTDPATDPASATSRELYLDLMAKVLTRYGFEGRNSTVTFKGRTYESYLWNLLRRSTKKRDIRIVEAEAWTDKRKARREVGRDWPVDAETMAGLKRLANARMCVESVIADGVPGDIIETGAWRGGTCIYMRAVLKAHGVTDRTVWVADSFEGLPEYDGRFEADAGDVLHSKVELAISQEQVEDNFRRYELLDGQVRFLKGFFADTLPTAPVEQLAVLRLDGDMYSSTMDALENLYDKVSVGGYVIVDDYGAIPACAKAVHDFRDARGITDEIIEIDWTGSYWRKS